MTGTPSAAVDVVTHGASAAPAAVLLLPALVLLAGSFVVGVGRYAMGTPSLSSGVRRLGIVRAVAFLSGLATVALALLGPVERLADERFAWHMAQHMLLIVGAAPLLAAGAPAVPLLLLLPVRWRRSVARLRYRVRVAPGTRLLYLPVTAWLAHVAALWLWHLPPAYDAALRSEPVHAAEHLTFLVTAWAFWWHVLQAGRRRLAGPVAVLYVFATMMPAAALGAVLTFARAPLYPPQAAVAARHGIDPLVDQQVAGLVMWVPPDAVYLLVTVALFLPWLTRLAGQDDEMVAPDVRPRRSPSAHVPTAGAADVRDRTVFLQGDR